MTGSTLRYIALHAVCAAAFIFVLNYYILDAGLETAMFWAIGFAVMAGGLAYQQTRRSGS
jgi:hypothetical protein